MGLGNFSNVKGVGLGVYEYKIDFGPGYRIYFGKDGETLVIRFGGGTKQRQSEDIFAAPHAGATTSEERRKGRDNATES